MNPFQSLLLVQSPLQNALKSPLQNALTSQSTTRSLLTSQCSTRSLLISQSSTRSLLNPAPSSPSSLLVPSSSPSSPSSLLVPPSSPAYLESLKDPPSPTSPVPVSAPRLHGLLNGQRLSGSLSCQRRPGGVLTCKHRPIHLTVSCHSSRTPTLPPLLDSFWREVAPSRRARYCHKFTSFCHHACHKTACR